MNLPRTFFITGTDTGVGKTRVSAALLHALGARGLRTAAMKPVAAGAVWRDGAWWNEDVETLASAANVTLPMKLTTPYLLKEAAAPHIAAAQEGVTLDIGHIVQCYETVAQAADYVVAEGVGGFCVPLDARYDTADLACALDAPIILVVGLRLGCLNHALLTLEAIHARGLKLVGWVANQIDPMLDFAEENIDALHRRLTNRYGVPLLDRIPYCQHAATHAVSCLNLEHF
jgi:dethiobiotin synthetase